MNRSHVLLTVILLLVWISSTRGQSTFSGKTMGPIDYKVVVYDSVSDQEVVENGIQAQLDQINSLMSTYVESSDISKVNAADKDQWVPVDPLTLQVVQKSIQFSELTGGAFDVTVGPAVNRWKFGPESDFTETDIDELVEYVGFANISIRSNPPAISKRHAKTRIDLSAIAKGFAVDQVAKWLKDQGYENFMVEVGGEVVAMGKTKRGKWRIGIERPSQSSRQVASVAVLSDAAMATSGDYRNFRIENGKRVTHTIDPVTCRPVENNTASCSIVAKDCLTADAIATAVMVMGPEKGMSLCQNQNWQASIITRVTGSDTFHFTATENFPLDESTSEIPESNKNEASIFPAFVGAMIIFGLAIAGMAVGAIFNNRPITGSCGGIAATQNADGSSSCSMCQKPVSECPENQDSASATSV